MDDESSRARKRVHFETKLIVEYEGEEYAYHRTYDVSMNGVFVKTVKPLPLGTKLPFKMTLGFGMRREEVMGICEVVRVVSIDDGLSETERGPGMGFKFVELEPESSEILFNVIRYNQPAE